MTITDTYEKMDPRRVPSNRSPGILRYMSSLPTHFSLLGAMFDADFVLKVCCLVNCTNVCCSMDMLVARIRRVFTTLHVSYCQLFLLNVSVTLV